jgi:hypothetical protein
MKLWYWRWMVLAGTVAFILAAAAPNNYGG